MKTKISEIELSMKEILNECDDIIDDSYLKTQDARRIVDAGYKLLSKCEELRISRDNWRNKNKTKMKIDKIVNFKNKETLTK